MASTPDTVDTSARRLWWTVVGVVRTPSGVGLPAALGHRPLARDSIESNGGPSRAVFIAEMDQQRPAVTAASAVCG